MTNFAELPPEILNNVISHIHSASDLMSAACVNSKFLHLCVPYLWSAVTVDVDNDVSFKKLGYLIQILKGRYTDGLLQSQKLSSRKMKRKFSTVMTEQENFVAVKTRRLSFTNKPNLATIGGGYVGESVVDTKETLFKYAKFIKNFKISCHGEWEERVDLSLFEVFCNLERLELLEVERTALFTDTCIRAMAQKSNKTLKVLNISHCCNVTDASMKPIVTLRNLRSLSFNGSTFISDYGLEILSKGVLDNLAELCFRSCSHISDRGLNALILCQSFVNLKVLVLAQCPNISGDAAAKMVSLSKGLEVLLLDGVEALGNENISQIVRSCSMLRLLSLEKCTRLTDESVIEISKHCAHLESLNYTYGSLNDASVNALSEAKLPNLFELFLGKCIMISQHAFKNLFSSYPHLLHIYLAGCTQIDDECIRHLIASCPNIQILSIPGTAITDASVFEACKLYKTLKIAQFSFCNELTPHPIGMLAYTCKKLNILQLVSCQKLKNSFVQKFSRPCPEHLRRRYGEGNYCALRPPNIDLMGKYWSCL